MSLYTVSSGTTINAQDVNQLVNVLQQQSGGQELGKYYLTFNASASGYFGSVWIVSLSRVSTPVSVTIDTSIANPVFCNNVATSNLGTAGFQIFAQSTGANGNCRVGGVYTIQY